MTAVAFQTQLWPYRARLNAIYGSDISHFDVPVMAEVLAEAYETVEHGVMTEDNFRDFVFTNPARFYTDTNPDFFEGTPVEQDVAVLNT